MRSTRAFLALSSFCLALLAGCASSSDDTLADGEEQEAALATPILEAKLYDSPDARPTPWCDGYTALRVTKGRSGAVTVTLENKVTGGCEIYVVPNRRSFRAQESSSCGSKVYEGTRGDASIRVQDNRTRLCEDVRPALIEVKETNGDVSRSMFGAPLGWSPPNGGGNVSAVLAVRLYTQPNATPSPGCDRYRKLTIGREGDKLVAHMKSELSPTSFCEIYVLPNEKTYEVTESASCGSKVYEGASGADKLRVQDNRTRLCEDVRPDVVEVRETTAEGEAAYFGKP